MARARTQFVCQQCGSESPRWLGRCPDCGEWNSLVEEAGVAAPAARTAPRGVPAPRAEPITAISLEDSPRVPCGIAELDRVLGGGCVPGSLVLIGGDPGIGKSTLLLQAACRLAELGAVTLYVTGEESVRQVRMRAERLGALTPGLLLVAETNLDAIEGCWDSVGPAFVVIDSIQTLHDEEIGSAPGTVTQVRGACHRLMGLARSRGTTVFLVGHVTKEGTLAGPRVLEHMVDTVLYFEGDRSQSYRVLRAVKNRFGSTDEIGLFEMAGEGLIEVPDPSGAFLGEQDGERQESGVATAAVLEGTRPLLVEVQALVARSFLSSPRRTANGIDPLRAAMLLAVLERRCGLRAGDKDVYINVTGGLRVSEPAVDLAVAVAIAGSFRDTPTLPRSVFAGEIGLSGEVRPVSQMDRRLAEAARLGFRHAVVPRPTRGESPGGLEIVVARRLPDVLARALPGRIPTRVDEDPFAA